MRLIRRISSVTTVPLLVDTAGIVISRLVW